MSIPGVIKSFNDAKGFGFINSDQLAGDVFFQTRDLPPQLQQLTGSQVKNCTVMFEIHQLADGKLRARGLQLTGMSSNPVASPIPAAGPGKFNGVSAMGTDPTAHLPKQTALMTQQEYQQLQQRHLGKTADDSARFTGQVNSYNEGKGWGFIGCDMLPSDSYFKKQDVVGHVEGMNLKGAKVSFESHVTQDGKLQARSIMVDMPGAGAGSAISQMLGPTFGNQRPMPQMAAAMAGLGGIGPQDGSSMSGSVKMCDANKGFGFIAAKGLPTDVYFKCDGPAFAEGQPVTFTLKWMKDGKPQARDVSPGLTGGEMLTGTIKTFSEKNGYGFLSVPESAQDIYFNKKDLPPEMQTASHTQLVGCSVQCTVQLKPDGKPCATDLMLTSPPTQGGGQAAQHSQGQKRPAEWADEISQAFGGSELDGGFDMGMTWGEGPPKMTWGPGRSKGQSWC